MKNYTPIDDLLKKHKKTKLASVSFSKEGESVPIFIESKEAAEKVEYARSENEPKAERKEIKEYVTEVDQEPKLHPELKKAGLQYVDSSKLSPFQNLGLPISDEKVVEGLHKPINTSWRWLSELAVFILGQAHIILKTIHGKVVRVIKR
ncbi:hypothetical protein A3A93_05950 [Candidatus Roizmanbacteria bacterium RIFCSPLOWO2_01_FULL_38_12]|uniref:Uncharacterized protein n=1 Tax=Candidatus Roizmanbacteria bacterium RIFCSPLOWO2_01_FULL_38_12 TaxID=1802061 RepID=A0A1F7IVB4_9BACT|nr:MAG: hypothetical protein A2861_02950 [Candidatus Roizmanbacteria bacterium RIFCSPHIGHO2_01_FULL_38_15]OGK36261.1 MAG: hypothetical protein A3F59_00090 [Candidatus Roizmanbacteria bacterium RIFCSPHIGHO2_12_FULL_38_13]OGK47301.1 MAG: hypothetical protein A3A93_05950 [Candidatus Roizmanbacteria bacterium RIFCSPLOWO2_01_FULL_38_12]